MSSNVRSSVEKHLARVESAVKESLNVMADEFIHQNAAMRRELQSTITDLAFARIDRVHGEFFRLTEAEGKLNGDKPTYQDYLDSIYHSTRPKRARTASSMNSFNPLHMQNINELVNPGSFMSLPLNSFGGLWNLGMFPNMNNQNEQNKGNCSASENSLKDPENKSSASYYKKISELVKNIESLDVLNAGSTAPILNPSSFNPPLIDHNSKKPPTLNPPLNLMQPNKDLAAASSSDADRVETSDGAEKSRFDENIMEVKVCICPSNSVKSVGNVEKNHIWYSDIDVEPRQTIEEYDSLDDSFSVCSIHSRD